MADDTVAATAIQPMIPIHRFTNANDVVLTNIKIARTLRSPAAALRRCSSLSSPVMKWTRFRPFAVS